jgi:DNA repair exonuclease SbcCD ATPase subunit
MKILFTKLRYKNFLSIGKNFVEIDLNTSKRTLIFGKNGKGKSTILDALVFSLFGKPFRNINKPTVVNSINKSNCVTEIEFVIGENYYKIIRGLKPAIFEIYKNGELIKQNATVKEYQILLEETILKTNYKSFIQIVILGSANYIPFMQLTASERRFIVEDLLDIQVFSTMNIIAKDRLSILKSEIDKLKFDITITQSTIDNKKQFLTTIKDNSNTQLISLENDINDFNDKITSIKQEISSLELEIIYDTQSIINKIEIENQKQRLLTMETKGEGFLNKINKHINFYENYDECPTCKQSIDLKFKNEKIDHHLKRKSIIENGLKKVKKDLKDNLLVMENITNISKEMLIKEKKITELQTTINRYTDFIENLNNKVNEIKNLETNTFELESQELLLLTNKYNDQLLTKESLLQQKRYLEVALSLLKDNGIKVKLIKKYLPVLNQLINKYLSS